MKLIKRTILFLIVSSCVAIVTFSSPSNTAIVTAAETNKNENLNIDELKGKIPVKDNKLNAINKAEYLSISSAGILAREKVYNHESTLYVYTKSSSSNPASVYDALTSVIYAETNKADQGDYMLWNVDSSSASYSAVKSKSVYYYIFKINMAYLMSVEQSTTVLSKADKILSDLKIDSATTEYDKIKKIYDYVCKNVDYPTSTVTNIQYSTYGALINHKAVCQGYASSIYLLGRKAGLSVRLIPGAVTYNGEKHGWNIVKIGNLYYNMDSTWDSQLLREGKSYKYFLRGDNFPYHARWEEFASNEFYAKYPMAASAYGSGSTKVSTNTLKAKFKIIKPKWKKLSHKKASFKKVSNASGYQIKYSTKKSYKKKYTKTVNIKKATYKFKKLKKKKYYVKFRAYTYISSSKTYTKWSKTKNIKK